MANFKRKLYLLHMRLKNRKKNFTIISQNCIGGVIYNNLGIEFKSPTINLFIEGEDFVKFVENLEHYLSLPAIPGIEKYTDPINKSISYPVIKIDDINVCCLHYKNCQEAVDAWNRRKSRVNFEQVFVIGNSWNLHGNDALIRRLSRIKYKTIIFTHKKYNIENEIFLDGDEWHLDERGILRPNLTDTIPGSYLKYFEKIFDYVGWLNS